MAGVDMVHVPYRGAAQMGQAVITGDAPFLIANLVNVMPFVRRGEVKLVAVTSLQRWPDTPDVPTLDESGLRGFETIAWNGILAPKGTPQPIRDRLHAELVKLKPDPTLNDRIRLLGGELMMSTPEAFAERIRADIAKWRDLAARVDIRAE